MLERCCNINSPKYSNYGERGIIVCDEWLGEYGFVNFYNWAINNGYTDELTIDRINVNGNYCPENCRWATWEEQANNKTNNHLITIGKETHTIAEWSKITGISPQTISTRILMGWDNNELINGVRETLSINVSGEMYTIKELVEKTGLTKNTICDRYFKMGLRDKELLKPPKYYTSKSITINGETKTITEWCNISGLKPHVIYKRLKSNWDENDLLKPVRQTKCYEYNGKLQTLSEWSLELNIYKYVLQYNINKGLSIEEIINK
jgi:hypothetical protein